MGRKDPSNFGAELGAEKDAQPTLDYAEAAGRHSIVLPERVFLSILRTTIDRLADPANVDDLRRFFAHFFDPMIDEDERESYITNFQREPPRPKLGYPRTPADFPCMALIMEKDNQDQEALGKYLGETQPGDPTEKATEYVGGMFEQVIGIYCYATHPDVALYNYHFAKATLMGAHEVLEQCGIISPSFDGNDMMPQEMMLPENMFVRRLAVTLRSLHTVPVIMMTDPVRVKVTGIWHTSNIVGGVRGGVSVTDPDEDA